MDPRILRRIRKIFAPFKRIGLKKKFTLLSNNCWGGRVYDIYGLKYLSPTIGLTIKQMDFLKFCNNLDYYLSKDLIILDEHQEKVNNEFGFYSCKLDDITITFVHYRNAEDGINKWNRRRERVKFDNIIVKTTYVPNPNYTKEEFLKEFSKIKYKKILFTTDASILSDSLDCKVVYFENNSINKNYAIENEFAIADKLLKQKQLKEIINR